MNILVGFGLPSKLVVHKYWATPEWSMYREDVHYTEKLHKYSTEVKIISRQVCWDQEQLFDGKNQSKNLATLSISSPIGELYLGLHATMYMTEYYTLGL